MKEFEFELIFRLIECPSDPSIHIDKLYECGCDDVLIGIGQLGTIKLSFLRDALNAQKALNSAINDVKKAIPTAILVEASPDYVTTTDAATIIGWSRQYMRNLLNEELVDIPLPIHMGSPSIFHLSDILNWIIQKNKAKNRKINESIIEVSEVTRQINSQRLVC